LAIDKIKCSKRTFIKNINDTMSYDYRDKLIIQLANKFVLKNMRIWIVIAVKMKIDI